MPATFRSILFLFSFPSVPLSFRSLCPSFVFPFVPLPFSSLFFPPCRSLYFPRFSPIPDISLRMTQNAYLRGNLLPQVRLLDLRDGNPRNRRRHPGPALESRRPPLGRVAPRVGAADSVHKVAADLVGRLQSEKVEAPATAQKRARVNSIPIRTCVCAPLF